MRPESHRAVLGTVLGCAVAALAAGTIALAGSAFHPHEQLITTGDASDVTGSIRSRRLPLSEEERGHIFDGIMRVRNVPVADVPVPEPSTALPNGVPLQELPASVTHDIPMVQGYKFVKLDDWILLVSPVDRRVVAEMPRYRIIVD
jgi:hypothetical protein